MIKCLVVDDEPLARAVLARYIDKDENLVLAGECGNVIEAFRFLEDHQVDLLFLDIKMPVINGIDFMRSLKHPPPVIFTTAYAEYGAVSYETEAIDYLLKPITLDRFKKAIDRYLKKKIVQTTAEKEYIYIKTDGRLVKVYFASILYAESMKDYMKIVTLSGNYITHLTMKSLIDLLPAAIFQRVHRSFAVNRHYIKSISRKEIVINETRIPVGESYKNVIIDLKENL